MPAKAGKNWKYDAHPSIRMVQSIISGMKENTGRSLEEWLQLAQKKGPAKERQRKEWLKKEYGLGTNYAGWIAGRSLGKSDEYEDPKQYLQHALDNVESMFGGPKAHLRPIYDGILTYAMNLGLDIRVSPCRTIVPIYRKHVIAQIKPTTRTRIDLGLALKDAKVPKRLINTGGYEKKDRITHRIEITKPEDFDEEAKRWIKIAYEKDV
jgi:Domain of unknown function (DUF5655)/Domain of unknown function (DUF4287)